MNEPKTSSSRSSTPITSTSRSSTHNEEAARRHDDDDDEDEDDDDDDEEDPSSIMMMMEQQLQPQQAWSSSSSSSQSSFFSYNFQKLTILEISGSCGDFGTLLPLLVALARERKIYLTPTLLGTGIVHIITGLYWDIPMPLQPMKSIASLAIAGELTRIQVTTAGIGMGIIFLGPMSWCCGFIEFLHKWIPKSVIGGLQLGVGWKLAIKGIRMIQDLNLFFFGFFGGGDGDDNDEQQQQQEDCIFISIVASLLCLFWLRPRRSNNNNNNNKPPIGIYLFGVGMVMAAIKLFNNSNEDLDVDVDDTTTTTKESFIVNALQNATFDDWKVGFLQGSIPQLPLTTLNSCLSVCMLAHTLFPNNNNNNQKSNKITRRSVCTSIGLMNLILCPLGCMPNCHGAGGLAAQWRFGAQSGMSMIILGIFKIMTSILSHYGYLLLILDALPVSILGVMLILAGHELAMKGVMEVTTSSSTTTTSTTNTQQQEQEQHVMICLVTALVIVGTGQTHIGALCGWITFMIYGTGYNDLCCGFNDNNNLTTTGGGGDYTPVNVQPQDLNVDDDEED